MAHASLKLIAVAVVRHGGDYLVGRRPEGVPLAGYWEFPGGKVEPRETAEAAAVRECREETGLDVQVVGEFPPVDFAYSHGTLRLRFFSCELADGWSDAATATHAAEARRALPVEHAAPAEHAAPPEHADASPPTPLPPFKWIPASQLASLEFPPANAAVLSALIPGFRSPAVSVPSSVPSSVPPGPTAETVPVRAADRAATAVENLRSSSS